MAPSTNVKMSGSFEYTMSLSMCCFTVNMICSSSVAIVVKQRARHESHTDESNGNVNMLLTVERLGCRNIVVALTILNYPVKLFYKLNSN
jgi:hypothetical protein